VLLIDVWLVILYYILVRGVETPKNEGPFPIIGASTTGLLGAPLGHGPLLATAALVPGRTSESVALTLRASAAVESWTIMVVFLGYLLWDVFTKAVVPPEPPAPPGTFWGRMSGEVFWRRGWASVSCAVLAILSAFCLCNVTTYWGVIVADVCFLMLVLLFRAWKDDREWVWKWLSSGLFLAFVVTGAAACLLP
jgi:hypothetical protein